MWCDNFDMDLPRILPAFSEIIGPAASIPLYTRGHETDGKLNHPTCWNGGSGFIAFFGFAPPRWTPPELPERGNDRWNVYDPQPPGYTTADPFVHCTFDEAVRDGWCHSFVMIVGGQIILDFGGGSQEDFTKWMYHIREWSRISDAELTSLVGRVTQRLQRGAGRIIRALPPAPGTWEEKK